MTDAPWKKELDEKCEFTFLILHSGWGMDNKGWAMTDGRVFTSSHGGGPDEMLLSEIDEKIFEAEFSLAGLKSARKLKGKG